jgi:hypothetical protein
MEDSLCEIKFYNANLDHRCLLLTVTFPPTSLWHTAMLSAAGVHPSILNENQQRAPFRESSRSGISPVALLR